jgi:hypothetical protein
VDATIITSGEMHDRCAVHIDHGALPGCIAIGEFAVVAKASVVHQDVDCHSFAFRGVIETLRRGRIGQVIDDHHGLDLVFRFEPCAERLEPVGAARGENQVRAGSREFDRQRVADARARARHQCPFACICLAQYVRGCHSSPCYS